MACDRQCIRARTKHAPLNLCLLRRLPRLFGDRLLPHHLAHIVCLSRKLGEPAQLFSFQVKEPKSQYITVCAGRCDEAESADPTYTGKGAQINARNAMMVHAQLTPRLPNMAETNNGNLAVSAAQESKSMTCHILI